ncbi:MAG: MBL fold metallo-hydrolase [Vicinamibacterales bacterium]|nr:MBL fold metallo-hydrolase [Acidobacteriota bacterium]MDP7294240.1 MBL fold metallo-hydrolase [Vicinamibacterales bacterium]MDP7472388.1 MBL fold metallo-hydrolase [Vicinamibacterales bacterium]MDP7670416.1 MBL fold metallo-hydrolase [Vicinamibacterales bacterium]HJO38074.1 MBL fold metallo-hydrolase [Vicinamibacterales bacterium]
MKLRCRAALTVWLCLGAVGAANAAQDVCRDAPLAVQVLGSGGPFPRDGRASSSYLIWIDGRARLLVDAGGGASVRFGEAGARIEDLSLLAISHFHPDHVSDVPALLWVSQLFRTASLPFAGPSGNNAFPAVDTFLDRLFGDTAGAFPVLSRTVGGGNSGVARPEPTVVFASPALSVTAQGVPHTNAPTVAYRAEVGEASVVFSSDQTGADPRFIEFARDATVLVMHLAVAEATDGPIHARPSVVGQIARDAGVGTLILSHFMGVEPEHPGHEGFSLADQAANVAIVRRAFEGDLVLADDLLCLPID